MYKIQKNNNKLLGVTLKGKHFPNFFDVCLSFYRKIFFCVYLTF